MNKKVIIIGVVILILGGVVFYFASQKTTPTTNQSSNQNIVPAQKLFTGNDIKIVGTVVENITEYAPVDGPAYLNVRTDDGAQIRVTYSPGEAECRNVGMASTGFSVKVGARVEVFAKAISEKELFTCDSTAYYIKTLTTTNSQQNSETTSWKVFKDSRYTFQFNYPVKWNVGNQQGDIRALILKDEKNSEIITVDTGVNLAIIGISYCGAYPQDKRCETLKTESGGYAVIDWDVSGTANAMFSSQDGTYGVSFALHKINSDTKIIFKKVLSTFKFIK